jgi:LmbE family N-acetylglucosaminyl deacetylase
VDPNRRYIRHRDHYICGRVTLDAVFPYARDHLAFPEHLQEGLEPHNVQEVYLWGAEEPDTFLDITETFSIKLDALYCHASQMKRARAEREERTRAYYAEIGKRVGVPLAEPFKRIEIFR